MRCALANRGTHAVHRGVAAAQYHDAFAFHTDERFVSGFAKAHDLFGVGNQEWQGIEHAVGIFVFQPAAH